MNKQNWFTWF